MWYLPAAVLLPGGAGAAAGGDADPLLDRYLRSLVLAAYAPEGLLRECLPASISAGMVLDVLRLAGYPIDDPAQRLVVSERLSSKLNQLRALCELLEPAGRSVSGDQH